MAFVVIPGIQGSVFVPDKGARSAKYACGECFACQWCSEDRCRVCRREDGPDSSKAFGRISDADGVDEAPDRNGH